MTTELTKEEFESRAYACPLIFGGCAWKDSASKLLEHFSDTHKYLIKKSVGTKLVLDKSSQGILMTVKGTLSVIFKYFYNANDKKIRYDIRYCASRKYHINYKIQLCNSSNRECNINLKSEPCLSYDNNFYGLSVAVLFDLNKYLPCLDCPDAVDFLIDLKLAQRVPDSIIKPEVDLSVNYELLETIRCKKCNNYLIPPLFDITDGTICADCNIKETTSVPTVNTEIQKLVIDLNYPCQWPECDFVGKSNKIIGHSMSCEHRIYRCFVNDYGTLCPATFKITSAIDHLQTHGNCQQMASNGVYRTAFKKIGFDYKYVYTIRNGTLIAVAHNPRNFNFGNGRELVFFEFFIVRTLCMVTSTVQIHHEHCSIKSKPYMIYKNLSTFIQMKNLPTCFNKYDSFTVVFGEFQW